MVSLKKEKQPTKFCEQNKSKPVILLPNVIHFFDCETRKIKCAEKS